MVAAAGPSVSEAAARDMTWGVEVGGHREVVRWGCSIRVEMGRGVAIGWAGGGRGGGRRAEAGQAPANITCQKGLALGCHTNICYGISTVTAERAPPTNLHAGPKSAPHPHNGHNGMRNMKHALPRRRWHASALTPARPSALSSAHPTRCVASEGAGRVCIYTYMIF